MQRIRTRLIAAFMLVSILPAIPLFFVVRDLFDRSFEPRGGERIREALAAGLAESRESLRAEKESFREEVRSIWFGRSPGAPAEDAGVFDGREEGIVVRRLDHPRLVDRARKADDPEAPVTAWADAAAAPPVRPPRR